ncbi:MAG: TIGR04282 family arsenosugar biosynthesis glycosyltransferase [Solirubrobacteraceae bacterium]
MSEPLSVVVMARSPRPGRAKTRLEPLLGPERCARLQAELIRVAVRWAGTVGRVFVAVSPRDALDEVDAPGAERFGQEGANLGERMAAAVERVGGPVVVIGTDMPTLGGFHARSVRADLDAGVDAVFGPAHDGGYYLVALRQPRRDLFALPADAWGGPEVLALSLARAAEARLEVGLLRGERDLDTPADARALLLHHALPPGVAAILRGQ